MEKSVAKSSRRDGASALSAFNEQLRLARASELALLGHLERAEGVLCQGGISRASAAELDLLARIHVRQGRFEDARQRWLKALERDAADRAVIQSCLTELETYSVRFMKRRIIEWYATLVLLVLTLFLGVYVLVLKLSPAH